MKELNNNYKSTTWWRLKQIYIYSFNFAVSWQSDQSERTEIKILF